MQANITTRQITELTSIVTAQQAGRSANRQKAISRLQKAISEKHKPAKSAKIIASLAEADNFDAAKALVSQAKPEHKAKPAANPETLANGLANGSIRQTSQRLAIIAKAGIVPPPPDFSAETHKRFRPLLAQVIEMVEAKDLDGLRAVEIKPVSSSPKAVARYRDAALIALQP